MLRARARTSWASQPGQPKVEGPNQATGSVLSPSESAVMRQKKLGRWGVASTCAKPRHAHRRPCPPIAMLHRRSNACRLPVWRGLQGSRRLVRSGTTRDLPSAQSPPAARVCGSIFFFLSSRPPPRCGFVQRLGLRLAMRPPAVHWLQGNNPPPTFTTARAAAPHLGLA